MQGFRWYGNSLLVVWSRLFFFGTWWCYGYLESSFGFLIAGGVVVATFSILGGIGLVSLPFSSY